MLVSRIPKIRIEVYEVKACRPITTIRVFIDTLTSSRWVKFKGNEVYEFAYVGGRVSVECPGNGYVPFSQDDFDRWFVVV